MPKKNFQALLQNPLMSPPHPHTPGVIIHQDDDDSDICPVCDGECTCSSPQIIQRPDDHPPPHHHVPISMAELSKLYAASPPSAPSPTRATLHSPPAPKPSLKIKLTVPQSMLVKKKSETPTHATKKYTPTTETTSVVVADGYIAPSPYPSQPPSAPASSSSALPSDFFPKRRGRPPKHVVAAREAARAAAASRPPSSSSATTTTGPAHAYATKLPPTLNPRTTLLKKKSAPKPKKKVRRPIVESDLSSLSDDDRYDSSPNDDLDDDHQHQLPTPSDDAGSVQFPTFVSASALSSMEDDEGEDDADSSSLSSFDSDSEMEMEEENFIRAEHVKARVKRELLGDDNPRRRENDWIIRPRKKSVGGSDVDMADLDTDGSDDDEDADAGGVEAAEDEDEDDDDETDGGRPVGAVGLVSGWSDDEESSFDADLFFANLSDSNSSTSSSDEDDGMIEDDDGDETQSEMSFGGSAPPLAPSLGQNLPFEITEAWDGQIVFTNGLSDGQGVFDLDFDTSGHQFIDSLPAPDSDVDMSPMDPIDEEMEEGYEEDEDAGSGDTTDEELVGEDSLPNERAMKLFSFPFSVSAINPMSTVSPGVSPAPLNRRPAPRPSDILSGRVFWDSDEERSVDGAMSVERLPGLRMGVFVVSEEEKERKERQAVIDEQNRGVVIPSPHPRFVRRKGKRGVGTVVEHALRKHFLSTPSTPLQTHPATPHPTPVSAVDDTASAPPTSTEEDQPIEIYDVLEAAYLDGDNDGNKSSSSMSEGDSRNKHLQHLDRWNSIPVGAFRQTREAGGSGDWGEDYGAIMKASPLSAMLWNKNSAGGRRKKPAISPVMLPVRDGDRTPTASSSLTTPGKRQTHQQQQNDTGSQKRTRQE
ncbi:hypothetical protein BDQ17DRAFT_809622 [Cyathus striatus]|nr:hypothetical protein BDQ17DRAFT_809622 [Cyathus striatus]